MAGSRDTSLAAYRDLADSGLLQDQERELMELVSKFFPHSKFTRKELSRATRWEINRVCGRVNSLVAKEKLTEYPETRDGGHLLSVAQPKAVAQDPFGGKHPQGASPASAAPDEQLIHSWGHDKEGKEYQLAYTAVGVGLGWPPDQDEGRARG